MSIDLLPAADRIQLMERGVDQLRDWLDDVLRIGLLEYEFSENSLHEISSRLVDAKLGGLARRVRNLSNIPKSEQNWKERILFELSQLYVYTSAFQRLESLPPSMQHTIYSVGGYNLQKSKLKKDGAIRDVWNLIGQTQHQEEQLSARRSWFVGANTKRFALVLEFTFGRNKFDIDWNMHSGYIGGLVYYPGTFSLRGHLFDVETMKRPKVPMPAYDLLAKFQKQFAIAVAKNPWIRAFPCSLRDMRLIASDEDLFIRDQEGTIVPITNRFPEKIWSLVAISGGAPISLFGEWNGYDFTPLSYSNSEGVCLLL